MSGHHQSGESFKLLLIERYDDLEFIGAEVENLRCVKCSEVAILPTVTNCGHILCKECPNALKKRSNPKCPKCKADLTDKLLCKVPELSELTKKIDCLLIKCLNQHLGCKYQGELGKMEYHLKNCGKDIKKDLSTLLEAKCSVNKDMQGDLTMEQEEHLNAGTNDEEILFTKDEQIFITNDEDMVCTNDELEVNFNPDNRESKTFYILLMGQSGAGKSTFVNSICNYLKHKDFNKERKSKLEVRIPFKFSLQDNNYQTKTYEYGVSGVDDNKPDTSNNENTEIGHSCTQKCKFHEIQYDHNLIKIIDTPGVGDTEGIGKDKERLDETLQFLTDFENMHAICIVLKPNETRLTANFKYCFQQILCQLNKSAVDNIIFLFTHTSGTSFMPSGTIEILQAFFNDLKKSQPYLNITFGRNNIYCFDNEGFKYLVACQNNLEFKDKIIEKCEKSWKHSAKECQRLMDHITKSNNGQGLIPHKLNESMSVNNARRTIKECFQPIVTTIKIADDNSDLLKQKIEEINECKNNKKKLQEIMCTPIVRLKCKQLEKPRMVCKSEKCVQYYKLNKTTETHYRENCCETCECYDKSNSKIEEEQLLNCKAFNKSSNKCIKCDCSYLFHQRIYEETSIESVQEPYRPNQQNTKTDIIENAGNLVKDLTILLDKYKLESFNLNKYWIMLATFLKLNAIIVENNATTELLKQENAFPKYSQKMQPKGIESSLEEQSKKLNQLSEKHKNDSENSSEKNKPKSSLAPKHEDTPINSEDVTRIIEEIGKFELTKEVFKVAVRNVVANANQNAGWLKTFRDLLEKLKIMISSEKVKKP